MVQSEQHVIYRLMAEGPRKAQADMKKLTEYDCHEWKPSRKEHPGIGCEICYGWGRCSFTYTFIKNLILIMMKGQVSFL